MRYDTHPLTDDAPPPAGSSIPLESTAGTLLTSTIYPFGLQIDAGPGDMERSGHANIQDLDIPWLKGAVRDHRYVVLRGFQPFVDKEHMAGYCRQWGQLLTWNFGEVLDLKVHQSPDNYLFTHGNVPFHWDGAFAKAVPSFMVFHCLAAPGAGAGGESLFCDTTRLWQSASEDQRTLWRNTDIIYRTEKRQHYGGEIKRPLIHHHPVTGEITMRFAERLNGDSVQLNPIELDCDTLSNSELDALIDDLTPLLYDRGICARHAWQTGDIVIIDNHALLHGRTAFHADHDRHLRRVHVI